MTAHLNPVAVGYATDAQRPPRPIYTDELAKLANGNGYVVVWQPKLTPSELHAPARSRPLR